MLVCTNCVGFIENVENVSTSIVVIDNDFAEKQDHCDDTNHFL